MVPDGPAVGAGSNGGESWRRSPRNPRPVGPDRPGRSGVCFAVPIERDERLNKRQEPDYDCQFAPSTSSGVKVWNNLECFETVKAAG